MDQAVDKTSAESSKPPKFHFQYYSERPPYWGYDGLPFGALYAVAFAMVVALVIRKGTVAFEHALWASVPVVLHVLLFLSTQWSVDILCLVKFKPETDIERATHVKVLPLVASKSGAGRQILLVPVLRESGEVSILYHKKKFCFNRSTGRLERLKFQVSLPLQNYLGATGLTEQSALEMSTKYGCNAFDIPLPTFAELFKEHAVAPFFVFQVFCVTLWLLDEYWYYSLLTLFMLIVLEAQMVHRRRSDLSELREMRIPPRPVHVYRDANWRVILSDQLIPGDILALMRKADAPMPCDVLLLHGSVLVNEAMLTGESVPQMKVAASPAPGSPELEAPLDMKGLHKQHIVSAGTHLMLHQNTTKAKTFKKVPSTSSSSAAIGYVLRTGFDTTQGKLCRTILFSAERVTVSSREAYYFLMILVAFALCACGYVLYDGLVLAKERPWEKERSTFKLFLSVSHILTSVVPPEFPIMLSLAVNLSLVALVRKRIFCTEPFRVPLAGKVETCCFDKTGTLTSDSMEVDGVHGLPGFPVPAAEKKKKDKDKDKEEDSGPVANPPLQQSLPFLTTAVMASCSGLTVVENEVVGDPLERAALQALRWQMISPDILVSKVARGADRITVLRRYPFVSELQRMAVLVRHQGPGAGYQGKEGSTEKAEKQDFDRVLALVKGSCEVIRPRLAKVPEDFSALQDDLTSSGLRVLCLAAKEMPSDVAKGDPEQVDRQDLESDLEFCGLLVLRNSVKQGTVSTVKQLRRCYHRVVMITGDHPLTACQVALSISMAERPFLMLERRAATDPEAGNGKNGDKNGSAQPLEWRFQAHGGEEKSPLPFKESKVASLARKHSLCIVGKSLSELREDQLSSVAPYVTVFARVSPQQKEEVIAALNLQGNTMMVGDGTNDVGALKHAHVGVSLLTSTTPALPSPAVASEGRRSRSGQPQGMHGLDDGSVPLVRLGDASIASPFTYKGDSVKCSMTILRCGRATLSTVLMMYKIMGLNSIMSAFAMSVLTLDGVKLGDGQTAVESLFISMCFFLVSRSAPAKQLAKMLPTYSVFAWQVMVTLMIQLVVHLTVLLYGWRLANNYRAKDWKRDIEGDFEPNLTNTVVFNLMATMHASSFLANYEGHPFMQPLYANKSLMYCLMFFVSVIFTVASEAIPELNESLSLVIAPDDGFRQQLCLLIGADVCLSVGLSKAVDWYAIWRRSCAAEKRAKQLGLGISGGE